MKRIIPAAVLSSLLVLPALSARGEELPKRKSGLWEIEMVREGAPAPQKMKQCIDAATDSSMGQLGQDMAGSAGSKCAKKEVRKEGDAFVADSECTFAGRHTTSHIVYGGNFESDYQASVSTTFDPPIAGRAKSNMKMTGRWLGPCEAGQQPGDMIMANGMKLNMNALAKSAGH